MKTSYYLYILKNINYYMVSYIGCDLSLTSAALVIKSKGKYHFLSYMKNFKNGKWIKKLDFINFTGTDFISNVDYSINENNKLKDYDYITSNIINDIKKITGDDEIIFNIEGYSYSSGGKSTSIIDLVTYTTLFRSKMVNILNAKMNVISPSTLKMQSCYLTYGGEIKRNKKGEIIKILTKTPEGISGGTMKKHQIFKCLNDSKIDNVLTKFIRENFLEIYKMSSIIKPLDDINDAFFLLLFLELDVNNIIKNG